MQATCTRLARPRMPWYGYSMSWINFVLIIFHIDFSRCITIVAYILKKSIENFKILCLIYFLKINIKGCNVDIYKA